MRFEPVSPDNMIRPIVELLPRMKPGPGGSLTISRDLETPGRQRRQARNDDFVEQSWLQPSVPPGDSADATLAKVQAIMDRPRLGSGYFAVITRDRNGYEREPLAVNWLDTDAGRYVITSTQSNGRLHITYSPADHARIDQAVSRELNSVF